MLGGSELVLDGEEYAIRQVVYPEGAAVEPTEDVAVVAGCQDGAGSAEIR
jgi:hypothetical protein